MKNSALLNDLYKEVDAGRVSVSTSGDLSIFKYTQETHNSGEWNAVNRLARGIIFRTDGEIVARPFEKFFNLGEVTETQVKNLPWHEGIEVYEKMDGSCGIGYFSSDGLCESRYNESYFDITDTMFDDPSPHPAWKLATPGSMESDQAIEGTKILNSDDYDLRHLPKACTPVFEIIYPENQIVVDYDGRRELVLLAIFEKNGEEWHPRRVDQIAEQCGFRRPRRFEISAEQLQRADIPFQDNEEGYVIRFGNGVRVKVKSPRYMQLHRLLDNCSPKRIVALIQGREYGVVISQLPKKLAVRFDDIRAMVQRYHDEIITIAYAKHTDMLAALGSNATRKQYALWIQENVEKSIRGLIFNLLDNKEIDHHVWKIVTDRISQAS